MRALLSLLTCTVLAAHAASPAPAPEPVTGEVRVPLSTYTKLVDETRGAPAGYALGVGDMRVRIESNDERRTAMVTLDVSVQTFEPRWTLVPLLPPGAALAEALVDGSPVELVQGPDGLSYGTDRAGKVDVRMRYSVDARASGDGYTVSLPMPRAPSTALVLEHPAGGADLALVPAAEVRRSLADGKVVYTARIPAVSALLVSWRADDRRTHAVSRARYAGELDGDALAWRADFDVEVMHGERVVLPLMPSSVTLGELAVDGERATVIEEKGRFVTVIEGRGMHTVHAEFQVPVITGDGPPRAELAVPRVPVSHFELALPGKKTVTVSPSANVTTEEGDERTVARAYVQMSEQVTFSWVDAIPEDVRTQVRANATLYHAAHAEEGVLHLRGLVVYEVSRGETSQLKIDVPPDAQVSRIVSPSGGVSDWVESAPGEDGWKTITVVLNRAVKGELVLDVQYERLLGGGDSADEPVAVPLLAAGDVDRQRGMLALLSAPELVLEPVSAARLSPVGENQLPAFVRNLLAQSVTHTYKYTEARPELVVRAAEPPRRQGKFDAQVDTLISIGEVTMRGSATVEVNVKSGAIMDLALRLPANLNVLAVSGPSMRAHEVRAGDEGQLIDIEFTQEMEGQFRLEVNYERIMADTATDTEVPTITVADAEVEHGRIAVEALTAVEVQPVAAEQLSSVEVSELPRQLVLKTTNPILLAYKYVHAEPPYRLALAITRHQEIDVQVAAIENASYATLFTGDGLAVTTARFDVRNSRRQFLRLEMPPESQIWSVFVDGKAEKPAQANGAGDDAGVLVRMINSATGFPVEMVYATRISEMGFSGHVGGRLPNPDMVVTRTRWDVYLPVDASYRTPDSTLDLVVTGRRVGAAAMSRVAGSGQADNPNLTGEPLRISVPTQGIHFGFEKLYANQSAEPAEFSIGYTSEEGSRAGLWISVLGAALVWLAIAALAGSVPRLSRNGALALLVAGIAALVAAIGYLGASPIPASALTLAVAVVAGTWKLAAWLRARRWRQDLATT